ncbi:DeoR/GlpR family DNA-binding transcription regulator [Jannaschia sp. M317]|uniref:DeoR/GlpR family DNA-binding transcription regulator n=1 Tax=Jannaschia sp. M317 TaxID=2867011 RepID=UPI0021A3FCAA|nr:DeoR/GlpR family DNA-binding transcription regulator [Jannaschia sp. M317]UWQ19110.1 DeoR/GlpR family DNA-binding transcription regulator [Jannaschia sp. M317]
MPDDAQNISAAVTPRHAYILDRLRAQPMVEVTTLAEELGVTAVTIRSDLDALDRKQLLRRIRGGAMAVRPARFEPPADLPGQELDEEKARIGAMAARMVRSGETIILDAGSTAMALALALPDDIHDVLIVTSSLDIAVALHGHAGIVVLVTGGKLKKTGRNSAARSLISPFGTLLLEQINADCAFLCCTGIDAHRGFTNASLEEVEIKRAMLRASRRVVVLGDSGKIGHVAGARIADTAEVSTLVSDSGARPADVSALEATGLQVLLA